MLEVMQKTTSMSEEDLEDYLSNNCTCVIISFCELPQSVRILLFVVQTAI